MQSQLCEFDVSVQVPFHSAPIKYEFDSLSSALFVKRFLTTCMHYPCHVGYLINTYQENNRPLEALIISPLPIARGCVLKARPIGLLVLHDMQEDCSKILMLPSDKLTPHYQHIHSFADLEPLLLDQIAHFFTHFEEVDGHGFVDCEGWKGKEMAIKLINDGIKRYDAALYGKSLSA